MQVQSIWISKDFSRTLRRVEHSAGKGCILILPVLVPRVFLTLTEGGGRTALAFPGGIVSSSRV